MSESQQPSFAALIGTLFAAADGLIIGATVCPGLLLCVPGIALVVVPLLVIGALLLVIVLVPVALALAAIAVGRFVARHALRLAAAARSRHGSADAPDAAAGRLVVLTRGSAERHA